MRAVRGLLPSVFQLSEITLLFLMSVVLYTIVSYILSVGFFFVLFCLFVCFLVISGRKINQVSGIPFRPEAEVQAILTL